ncbi:hypothetical protein GCM10010106_39670 [Thermopolyspora flexuosa]|mgnify:FL=1|uniref:GrpB-like predicted nucleotidyltransferase (UPF0157 family) n=1 Tax=Thermopolyspora flexuosa TaxID=103836 RepID=A0A543IU30_9ACTN|nr:GrpB family protein [Thermopolyspora flexuosa]TQM74079.1 GrpB-like predicted nucleotidyltransferase (UPF0157 family) [Thermopolyspora flexuosa]GGM88505.1 hypothetical protein GCM10010106_39670 [Thermopolyspora flexuosa]
MILVVDHDPAWPARFEALRKEYGEAMRAAGVPVIAIEHVGSTAVPGLAAKPIIDCDIVVAEEHVEAASNVLVGLGFTPLGERGIPQRWAFQEPERLAPTHTYVVVDGSLALRNHLAVRDTLRADPELRARYAEAKKRAARTAATIDDYIQGKNAAVQAILAAAGLTEAERATIDAQQFPAPDGLPAG